MIIAIDGPAASGKGTLAAKLARHYGLKHLDTGLLYRAVAHAVIAAGGDPANVVLATAAARDLDLDAIDAAGLRDPEIAEGASVVAAMAPVRAALLEVQRRFAATPQGAVLDGRDIGTKVCPDADVKIFVTASDQVRAERRHNELIARGLDVAKADILDDIRRRDARDWERNVAPLSNPDDAHLLDTTELDIEAAFRAAVDLVDRARST